MYVDGASHRWHIAPYVNGVDQVSFAIQNPGSASTVLTESVPTAPTDTATIHGTLIYGAAGY
jgi:hypothetical protein